MQHIIFIQYFVLNNIKEKWNFHVYFLFLQIPNIQLRFTRTRIIQNVPLPISFLTLSTLSHFHFFSVRFTLLPIVYVFGIVHVSTALWRPERGGRFPGDGVIGSCELPDMDGCGPNEGPLQEEETLIY